MRQSIEKIKIGLDMVFGFAKLKALTPPPMFFDLGGFVYE